MLKLKANFLSLFSSYLIRKAREVNPSLLVFAELFNCSQEEEVKFIEQTGVNAIIKELINVINDKLLIFG